MTGQLNTNLLNSNSEEIQEELDTLSNRLDGVESDTSANTDKINAVGNKVDNLANCVSTDSLNATNVATCNIQGSSATITDINANNITVCNKIKAANIEVDNIIGNINGDISANRINVCSANTININVTGKITAYDAKITTLNAASAKICQSLTAATLTTNHICNTGDATIAGCLNVKGICLTDSSNLYGNAVDVCDVCARHNICGLCHANIDGNLTVKGTINGKTINGNNITSNKATITSGTIDNLTVNCALTVAEGITLTNVLGDTTLTKVTTDCLLVNGDTELNGAVKAGSITIGDGSITAGEVCIGAKGIVIDKDKNGTFADVTANTVTTDAATISGKVTAACTESTDIVSTNVFAQNFYPKNITIDKDVGDLHYSRQLDTDDVGGVLVDCKTITPKEGATGIITKYKDTEANTINPDSIEYVNEKNGIKVVSCSTADKTSNAITLDTGTTTYGITANEKGLSFKANEDDYALQISKDGDLRIYPKQIIGNSDDPFIGYSKTDGSLYCKYVNILGDASQRSSSGNNYSCKIKEENPWNCCLVTTCYKCTPTACTVGNTTETQTKFSDYLKNYDCITSNYYCLGYNNNNPIEGCTKMVSCRGQDINSFDISLSCCDCTTLAGDTTIYNSCYSETTAYDGSKISRQYIRKNSESPVYSTIKTTGCKYQMLPTSIERHLSNGSSKVCDELAWKVCINDSNLYITNPQRTISAGCIEDILRVEDGKIYTKCGEFVAGGGSGGYFENATFSNNCISGTRSVVNDTITTCVVKSASGGVNCYSFETSTPNSICFGLGTNSCLTDSSPIPENNYKKNYFIYTPDPNPSIGCCCCYGPILCTEWSQQFRTVCPLYKSNSCYNIISNEYCYECCQISPTSGDVVTSCSLYKSDNCISSSISSSNTTSTSDCYRYSGLTKTPTTRCCYEEFCFCQSNNLTCCYCCNRCNNYGNSLEFDITCRCIYECFGNSSFDRICYHHYNSKCYSLVNPAFVCTICNQYCEPSEGNDTEICLGDYGSKSCNFVYNYICNCGTICGCSCEYEGDFLNCYACYPLYDRTSQYTRFFNGDRLCGCEYNTSTCQYYCFETCSCVDIIDSSIYKYLCINNSCVSIKEKVTTNKIANLPITNTLVPLAGKVNNKGFAFFCKGADGIKFYDGAFATVDAGTATDITYLVTTGV